MGLIPPGIKPATPGFYRINKDVNQGRVSILLPGVKRDHPDFIAIQIMNDILGGGGFTSRILNRVRSDVPAVNISDSVVGEFKQGTTSILTLDRGYQSRSGAGVD